MGIEQRLAAHGGCARRQQLVRDRRDLADLSRLIEAGAVRRVARGVFATPAAEIVVVAARLASGVPTCVSAAASLGLPLLAEHPVPHIAVPAHRAAPRPGLLPAGTVLHWDRERAPATVATTAPVAMALHHATGCLPSRDAVALLDAALHRGLVTLGQLEDRRPRQGRVMFDRLLRMVDGRSESLPETFLRLGLRDIGLQAQPQAMVDGVGRVDLLVERRTIVEIDGFAYHSGRRQYREDRRRDRTAQLMGLPVLRFTYEDAVHDTARAVLEIATVAGRQRVRR